MMITDVNDDDRDAVCDVDDDCDVGDDADDDEYDDADYNYDGADYEDDGNCKTIVISMTISVANVAMMMVSLATTMSRRTMLLLRDDDYEDDARDDVHDYDGDDEDHWDCDQMSMPMIITSLLRIVSDVDDAGDDVHVVDDYFYVDDDADDD